MQSGIGIKNSMGFILLSVGFLLLVTSLYFQDSARPVFRIVGLFLLIGAALHEYLFKKRHQTLIEVIILALILMWGIIHIIIW